MKIKSKLAKLSLNKNSIRTKLAIVIVFIVAISLCLMTFFSYYYFANETTVRIQDYNLGIVQGIGRQVSLKLDGFKNLGLLLSKTYKNNKSLAVENFNQNKEIIFYGLSNEKGIYNEKNIPIFITTFENKNFFQKINSSVDILKSINQSNLKYFQKLKNQELFLFNASFEKTAILGLAFKNKDDFIYLYIDPQSFFDIFNSENFVSPMLVDSLGNILAHQNIEVFLSHLNIINNPLFNAFQYSKVSSGQIRYTDIDNQNYLGSYNHLDIGNFGVLSYVSENLVFSPVIKLRNRNLILLVLVLVTAVGIILNFSRTITVPILSLLKATKEIEKGHFGIKIKPLFKDEVGSLTESFEKMARGLGEREKIKDAFGRFVNKDIAEQVLKGEIILGGEKKLAAISFTDLRGFTTFSENMKPEDVVNFLNDYFTAMVSCVEKNFGVVDKYIGDAIMAHWGCLGHKGNQNINETENAINSALMMRTSLYEFNTYNYTSTNKKRPFASIGTGINTGDVISGQIGTENRLDYTIIGDAVNLASRVESLNKDFETDIIITENSYNRVLSKYKVEQLPDTLVKGKEKPQILYAIIGKLDDPKCLRDLTDVREYIKIK